MPKGPQGFLGISFSQHRHRFGIGALPPPPRWGKDLGGHPQSPGSAGINPHLFDAHPESVYHDGTNLTTGVHGVIAAIVINLSPILVQLGPLAIRWYGLMYVVGILVGVQAGLPYVRARGITEDQVWNVLGPCIVGGLPRTTERANPRRSAI